MEKRRLKTVAALAIIGVVAVGIYQLRTSNNQQSRQSIQTVTVAKGTVKPVLTVTGVVAADERQIKATTGGKVEEIFVKEGDLVTAGQKLLRLDGTNAEREVNIAEANLNSAKARLQDLRDKSASAAEIAAQEAAATKASVDYAKANEARDALTITSPIDGTVIDVAVAVGDQAGGQSGSGSAGSESTSMGMITIADLTKLYIKAAVDQADISKVNVGQQAKVTLDALPGKEFSGQVTSIDAVPETNQNVVTYTAYISLNKLDMGARLGMSADISIDLGKKENVLVVPNIAVRSGSNSRIVTKIIDGEATEVAVEIGVSDSANTEITSGLLEGDKIVLQSFQSSSGRTSGSFGGGFPGMGGQRSGSGGRGVMIPGAH